MYDEDSTLCGSCGVRGDDGRVTSLGAGIVLLRVLSGWRNGHPNADSDADTHPYPNGNPDFYQCRADANDYSDPNADLDAGACYPHDYRNAYGDSHAEQ